MSNLKVFLIFSFFFVYNDAYLNKVTKYSPVPGKTFFVLKLLLL